MPGQNFFLQAQNAIKSLEDGSRAALLFSALRRSAALTDTETDVKIVSTMSQSVDGPKELEASSGIPMAQLLQYRVIHTRQTAVEYLNFRGVVVDLSRFRQRSNNQVYELLFNRSVERVETRNVYTYAEMCLLMREELEFRLEHQLGD